MSTARIHEPSGFKASYVWPAAAFPFRLYLDHPRARVFIIENIQHNWNWLLDWRAGIRDTDYFFVYCGWYHSPAFAAEADEIFKVLDLDKDNFFIMFNSPREMENFRAKGFRGDVINHNAWLDETRVMRPLPHAAKLYDAIYVARRSAFKRHMLARRVPSLALVAGNNHGKDVSDIPAHPAFLNDAPLGPEGVCEKINQAWCGLILSEVEGACFASSEYLLCGIPVVSTPSFGGRDVWYNDYNSVICDPTPEGVAAAVEQMRFARRDPAAIRMLHVELAKVHRGRFVAALGAAFARFGIADLDPQAYFDAHYYHKMRKSQRPDFAALFGDGAAA